MKNNTAAAEGDIKELKMHSHNIMMNQDNAEDVLEEASYALLAKPQTNTDPGYFLNTSDHHRTVLPVTTASRNTEFRASWSAPDNVSWNRVDPREIMAWRVIAYSCFLALLIHIYILFPIVLLWLRRA